MSSLAQTLFVTCVSGHASGKAPDFSNRVSFVASGLGLWPRGVLQALVVQGYIYLSFSLLILKNTGIASGIEPCVLCVMFGLLNSVNIFLQFKLLLVA